MVRLEDLRSVEFFSGGQSPWRDELVKVLALDRAGFTAKQHLHDVDIFSRDTVSGSGGSDCFQTVSVRERDGKKPWLSATKLGHFLGPLGVGLSDIKALGVNFHRLENPETVLERLSPSGYFGVVNGSSGIMIADVVVSDELIDKFGEALGTFFVSLRNSRPENARKNLSTACKQERAFVLDRMREFRGKTLVEFYLDLGSEVLGLHRTNGIRLDRSSTLFDLEAGNCSYYFLELFLSRYDLCARAYNDAIKGKSFKPLNRKRGELPYSLVSWNQEAGRWDERKTLYVGEEEGIRSVARLREELRKIGIEKALVIPKALVLPLEIRRQSPLALLEHGSRYMGVSAQFLVNLKEGGAEIDELCPVVRVKLSILDALSAVEGKIVLPNYLVPEFGGQKEISAWDFASEWQVVAERNQALVDSLVAARAYEDLIKELIEIGALDRRFREAFEVCCAACDVSPEYFGVVKGESRKTRRAKMAKGKEKGFGAIEKALSVFRREADLKRLGALAQALNVSRSLRHWNRKTFYQWLKLFGGGKWLEAVLSSAEIYVEE